MKPWRLLDPSFPYVSAANTDLKKTFERIRKEQEKERKHGRVAAGSRVIGPQAAGGRTT